MALISSSLSVGCFSASRRELITQKPHIYPWQIYSEHPREEQLGLSTVFPVASRQAHCSRAVPTSVSHPDKGQRLACLQHRPRHGKLQRCESPFQIKFHRSRLFLILVPHLQTKHFWPLNKTLLACSLRYFLLSSETNKERAQSCIWKSIHLKYLPVVCVSSLILIDAKQSPYGTVTGSKKVINKCHSRCYKEPKLPVF